jgi:hypothetical protein
MLPSSALPTDAIQNLVHQVYETSSHRSRGEAAPWVGGSAKIEFYSCHLPRMAGKNCFWGGLV